MKTSNVRRAGTLRCPQCSTSSFRADGPGVPAPDVIRMAITPDDIANRVRMLDRFQRRHAPDGLNGREEVGPAVIYPWTMLRQVSLRDLCRHRSAAAGVAEPAL